MQRREHNDSSDSETDISNSSHEDLFTNLSIEIAKLSRMHQDMITIQKDIRDMHNELAKENRFRDCIAYLTFAVSLTVLVLDLYRVYTY